MNIPHYISHIYQNPETGEWVFQSNESHTEGVARLAQSFAGEFGMSEFGRVLGELHDKGKESNAFQQHIKRNSGYDPSIKVEGDYHHAYVGAKLAEKVYGKAFSNLLVNQIYSHHTGLHDHDSLTDLAKDLPAEVDGAIDKRKLTLPKLKFELSDIHHLSRMLFSCLVDADFLDTERFMDSNSARLRQEKKTLAELEPLLDTFLANMKQTAKDTPVNRIRNEVQSQCLDKAALPCGFFSLTVPTGGGKTLSSLLWAMKHAVKNGHKRIIIAIPYTSIIVQTAAVLKSIFGEENVLEHHSNVAPEQIKDEKLRRQLAMAAENWDYPIIVTTNVQFFESVFGNRPSVCRKLHNIVNSVVILDEVQTLPTGFLQPIVDSLKTYNKLFHVSALFTTASQPILSGLIEGCNPTVAFKGIEHITEIIPSDFRLHDQLRRVSLQIDNGAKTYDEIVAELTRHDKVLCIVNTRRDAKEIYQRLPQEGITLHLSRMMCSSHIRETIGQIKKAIANEENAVVRVVATQLIEAGVDIDFPVVYRQESGLDSVLQAAGRCNREGKMQTGTTYVFSLAKEHALPRGQMQDANNARLSLDSDSDWFAPETMTRYFEQLYCRTDNFDKKDMKHYLYPSTADQNGLYFDTAAKEFRLIEDNGRSVIVCWKDSPRLIEQLEHAGPTYTLMKKLGQYIVNVNEIDFKKLTDMGVVSEVKEGLYAIEYQQQYDCNLGLITDNNWTDKTLMV